jgi:cytochrome P450
MDESATALLTFAILVVLWLLAHSALVPRPIRGIPYKRLSYIQPWGDLGSLGIHSRLGFGGRVFDWFSLRCVDLRSPLVQAFIPSISTTHPVLILSDLHEIEDIVKRRASEIDRADIMHTWFGLLAPEASIGLKSKSEDFRIQRSLWNVLLSPAFLNGVVAENAHAVASHLAHLWTEKVNQVNDLPFDVQGDIQTAMLESSWKNLFGTNLGLLDSRCKAVTKHRVSHKSCTVAVFEDSCVPEICDILRVLFSCLDWVVQGVTPRGYAWLFRVTGILGRAEREKNRLMDAAIHTACSNSGHGLNKKEKPMGNAIKSVLEKAARKEGSKSITHEALRDEALELLLTGGQSTTSALLSWSLKYLMDHTDIQAKLRIELRSSFDSRTPGGAPSADEIVSKSMPYLDAVIAETLRLSATGPVCFRQVVTACTILGHQVPAGTPLILVTAGPSFNSSEVPVVLDEARSKTSRKIASPDCGRMTRPVSNVFEPDRWLVNGRFDSKAIPMLPFSAGPRGCFGKSIAMLEMRIFLVVLMTRLALPRLAKQLRGHDAVDGLSRKPRNCYVSPKPIQ